MRFLNPFNSSAMRIFTIKTSELIKQTNDKNSHVIVLKPVNNKFTYYIGAAWEQDASGVKSMNDFKKLLKKQANFIKE
jgi:hypothetical protein